MDVIDDLEAELSRIEDFLTRLTDEQWLSPSAAAGWTIADVVLHLAQSEELVISTITGVPLEGASSFYGSERVLSMDEAMDRLVASQRTTPAETFARWRSAWHSAVGALRSADPDARFAWAATPLRPAALATTRLAEHWAHALDIVVPLQIDYPDTDRLRHIAWLAHRTLPYSLGLRGLEPEPVRAVLTGPSGAVFEYGPADAPSVISGSLGDFCRVGAQRLAPASSGLVCEGHFAATALAALRNYAA